MAKTIFILGCSDKKASKACAASEMYISGRFLAAKKIADSFSSEWFILSAKHGLLYRNEIIEPYDMNLNSLSENEYKMWLSETSADIIKLTSIKDHVIFFGDRNYFSDIGKNINTYNRIAYMPLEFISKDYKSSWLSTFFNFRKKLKTFYEIYDYYVDKYSLRIPFSMCSKKNCPEKGLYIFVNDDENRLFDTRRQRISRIGTHAVSERSKATLWNRIKSHKGTGCGYGNHRSSIFRKYIGQALLEKNKILMPSWNMEKISERDKEKEKEIEYQVTDYLKRKFSIIFINIPGKASKDTDRAYIERNCIALLSSINHFADIAPMNWLGRYVMNPDVQESGLWNVNHTHESVSSRFFDVFEDYLKFTCGLVPQPQKSLAPKMWRSDQISYLEQLHLI